MKADSKRWTQIAASRFAHEREALDHLREALPDQEPYRAFTNLEFIAGDGSINEVDALVLTKKGLFLVEIKSGGGSLSGDAGTWSWKSDRRERVTDNPLFLANQKAKKLKSLLQGQKALAKLPVPYVHAVVFCSAKDLSVKLSAEGRTPPSPSGSPRRACASPRGTTSGSRSGSGARFSWRERSKDSARPRAIPPRPPWSRRLSTG